MKFLRDYTGKEIEDASDSTIEVIISLECAEQGKPLLPPYPMKPERPSHKPDITLYKVGGSYGWYTKTPEDAAKLLKVLTSLELWDTEYSPSSCNFKKAKRKDSSHWDDPNKCEAECAFSPELWDKVSGDLQSYATSEKLYESQLKEYKSAASDRNEISNFIWEIVSDAKDFKRKRENYAVHLDDYINLADGDEKAGNKFFLKAYPDASKYMNNHFKHTDLLEIVKEAKCK